MKLPVCDLIIKALVGKYLNNDLEEYSIKIINSQGIVLEEFQERKEQISVSHLPTGIYFLVIDDIHYIKWSKI